MTRYIIDIEANGFLRQATQIWCIVLLDLDTNEYHEYTYKDNFKGFKEVYTNKANQFIAHNGIAYDFPVIKRLLGLELNWKQMYDTLIMSRMFQPDRVSGHSLQSYGAEFEQPKIEYVDFSQFHKDMITYCRQDVHITSLIWDKFSDYIEQFQKPIDIDREFAYYISLQEENGFTLDIEFANELCNELGSEREKLTSGLISGLPKVKKRDAVYNTAKKEGRLIAEDELGFSYVTAKSGILKQKEWQWEDFNPNSRQQIVDLFIKKYDWEPKLFTDKGSPIVDGKVLEQLEFEEAQTLYRIQRLTKQLGMVRDGANSWLNSVEDDGKVYGSVIVNGANGGRCTHNNPNVAQVDRKDMRMRECWKARDGWGLVGCDASGLELRILSHYLARWDKGAYAQIVVNGDIHTYNQKAMGLNERDTAKTAIYALIYGAGNEKLGKTVMKDLGRITDSINAQRGMGAKVRNQIKDEITGYRELMETLSDILQKRGWLKGIDGRPLFPRNDYSALNLLIQSAGASVMKKALNNFMRKTKFLKLKHGMDFGLVANIHDEVQIEAPEKIVDKLGKMFQDSIRTVTNQFLMKCDLDGEYKKGVAWSDTH